MNELTFEVLQKAVADTAAAFRCVTEYQPMGGEGDKVFPPTYEGGKYATEERILPGYEEPVPCVLLNSVQSEANHMELALFDAWEDERINLPVITVIMDAKVRIGYKKLSPKERLPFSALIQDAGFQWLGTRAEKHGFSVSEDGIKVDGYMQHRTFKKGGKHPIRFSTLDFIGLLTVTEPNIFVQTLFNGIGPAKGFGCGMMMVRRL